MIPGEVFVGADPVPLNAGLTRTTLRVRNLGDRPVQIGSHYCFALVNEALSFDRSAAAGQRLNVPAGTSVRFEPGIERDVELVPFGGARFVAGLR